MPNPRRLRPLITTVAAAAVAAVTLLAASSPALAAKGGPGPKPPAAANASASATVSGSDVTLSAKVNRPAADIASVACDVDGSPVACALTGSNKKNTTYGGTASGLADGDHTFHVTFNLTNATSASASASFTVDNVVEPPPPLGFEATCSSINGTLTAAFFTFTCAFTNNDGLAPHELEVACNFMGTRSLTTNNGDGTFYVEYQCPREPSFARDSCGFYGGEFDVDESFPFWLCRYPSGDGNAALVDSLSAECTAMSWTWSEPATDDGRLAFFCTPA